MYDPDQITFFAKTDARGQEVPFGIKASDRTRHVYVIGKTGMGKSTLLENMAVQDIKNGNGLAFIDPHGQTAETLLDYIPEERKDDVVYFAPFDTDNPVSFNVMEDVGEDKRHLVVSGLMSVFKKIWVDAWSARMEYILTNTLLALLEFPDATLLGVNRMLSDKEYRMRVIENITDPAVKSFWVDEFLKYNERYMQEAGDAIKNKIGQFTSNPLIRNIIGQPHSSFDIRKIMDEKKILIMNLSKGLVGDQNANLLGSMLTTRIYLAAMSRADLNAEEMRAAPNFYFYVDEFQSFANATFADILSEARKYKLNLTIAHQYIEQMEEEVRNAVFGNVGTIISFRVGPFDAEVLETVYTPKFLAPDIVNLGFAQVYLTLMIDGIGSTPFSATTLPPIEITGESYKGVVVARSQELYAKKRGPVEEVIKEWHQKNFSNKPPYVPKHLREEADGGTLPNTGENIKKAAEAKKSPAKPGNTRTTGPAGNGRTESPNPRSATDRTSAPHAANRTPDRTTKQGGSSEKSGSTRSENSETLKKEIVKKEYKRTEAPERKQTPERTPHRGDTSKPQASDASKERAHDTRAPKEKNLEDLRSVLQKLTAESEREQKKDVTAAKHDGAVPNAAPLKDVVAAAVAGAASHNATTMTAGAQTSSEQKEPTQQSAIKEKAQSQQSEKQKYHTQNKDSNTQAHTNNDSRNQPKKGEHKQHTHQNHKPDTQPGHPEKTEESTPASNQLTPAVSSDQQDYAQMKNIDNPLSVKKLERMMRVNTSDKPPIK
jgi:hypothetical protein